MTNVPPYSEISAHHSRHIQNVRQVSSMISRSIEHSRGKGWRSVCIPFPDAVAAVDVLDESANHTQSMFNSSIRALKIADKNRAIVDRVIMQPLQIVLDAYRAGNVTKETMCEAIKNFSTVRAA